MKNYKVVSTTPIASFQAWVMTALIILVTAYYRLPLFFMIATLYLTYLLWSYYWTSMSCRYVTSEIIGHQENVFVGETLTRQLKFSNGWLFPLVRCGVSFILPSHFSCSDETSYSKNKISINENDNTSLGRIFLPWEKYSVHYAWLKEKKEVPTCLGFALNRKLISLGLTIFNLFLINLKRFLLYSGVFILGNIFFKNYLFPPAESSDWMSYILPFLWQGLSWYLGAYAIFKSIESLQDNGISSIRATETSLIIYIPAILFLHYMDLPFSLLLLLAAGWFFVLAITLAIERGASKEGLFYRYDIIFFHLLVPFLVTAFFFFIAFSNEIHLFLRASQRALINFIYFIVSLLEKLFSVDQDPGGYIEPVTPFVPGVQEEPNIILQLPAWLIYPFLIIILLSLIPALLGLIRFLKTRVKVAPALPKRQKFNLGAFLRQLWFWLVALVRNILQTSKGILGIVKNAISKITGKVFNLVINLLAPKTPYEKILRSFNRLLRLGRKCGVPRKGYETPTEYILRLENSLEGNKFPAKEINQLTSIFLETHYGNMDIDLQQSQESERLLKIIKGKLKVKSKAKIVATVPLSKWGRFLLASG